MSGILQEDRLDWMELDNTEKKTSPPRPVQDPEHTEAITDGGVNSTSSSWRRRTGHFHPILICISGPQRGVRLRLQEKETVIGRSRSVDFQISDAGASRRHVLVSYENHDAADELPVCFVEDLESRNGTELNGKKIESRTRLAERDRITIGRTVLGFFLRDEEELLQEESIYEQATRDLLTGLHNRRQMVAFMRHYFERAQRGTSDLCLLFVDADHFKAVNDNYGHLVGDEVLRHMARLLSNHCRSSDLIARWGGEEVAIVLPDTLLDHASQLAERLRRAIDESVVRTAEESVSFTISIGGTQLRPTDTLDTLFQRADENLYLAKEGGRNICVVK